MNTYIKFKKDKKKKKKKISLTLKIIIPICALFITLSAVFMTTYYVFLDKNMTGYEKDIKKAINIMNDANSSTKDLIKGNSINIELSKTRLPNILTELKKAEKIIDKAVPGDKYKEQQNYIKEGLDQNENMYKQMLNILQNPDSGDISTSIDNFKKYHNDCETQYSLLDINNINLSLPDETLKFIDAFQTYMNTLVKVNRDTDIKSKQFQEFTRKMDEFISEFSQLKTNFSVYLKKARDKRMTFDDVISKVNNNRDKCSELKKTVLSINIPQECSSLQNDFRRLLEHYDSYAQGMIYDIDSEKTLTANSSKPLDNNTLKDTYSNSTNEYLSVNDEYSTFLQEYNKFKSNN